LHLLGLLASIGILASGARVINFDQEAFGKVPAGWTALATSGVPGRWEVLKDGSAPTQPYVLGQVSEDPGEERYPLAIWDGGRLRNGDVSVRIKPVSGKQSRGGGLVWRYRDPRNYYLVRADASQGTVAVYRVQNGSFVRLGMPAKHSLPPNEWRILKVAIRGDQFQVYVDHRRILRGEDRTYSGDGKVGVFTVADAVTYFDDFRFDAK